MSNDHEKTRTPEEQIHSAFLELLSESLDFDESIIERLGSELKQGGLASSDVVLQILQGHSEART